MSSWLNHIFLKPQENRYKTIAFFMRYFYSINLAIIILVIGVPLFFYVQQNQQLQIKAEQFNQLNEQKTQKVSQLHLAQSKQQQQLAQDLSLTEQSQQLQQLLANQQLEASQFQWQFAQGEKQLHLNVSHQADKLFSLIQAISQLEQFQFYEINLSKNQERQQIDLDLQLLYSLPAQP